MKKDIHPEYREVLFHDISVDEYFLLRSTLKTDKTKEWEGKEYPYYTVEVSSAYILFILVNKRLLIPVEEFKSSKKDLVRRNKFSLYLNCQNL